MALPEIEIRLRSLVTRVRRIVTPDQVLTVADLPFNLETLESTRASRPITLSGTGRRLLELLMRESPKVVTRQRLEYAAWGEEPPAGDLLRSHMYLLRRAIDQTDSASKPATDEEGPSRWSLGAGAVINDSPYAGEGLRVNPFPLIVYEGDRFYFRGITAGWRFITSEAFELSAISSLRLNGFEIDDLCKTELANNGLDYRLLDDRDDGIDAGLSATWRGVAGELEIELVSDVTDTSGGQEASIEYGYPIQWGKTHITPSIGVTWLSEDMANYYYGTLDTEIARGVVDYKPDAVTIPTVGVMITRPFGKRWSMIAMVEHSRLPDEIQDSPLLEPDSDSTFFLIGVARGF